MRNALLAVALAKHGIPGGETALEGEAGFYHAYAGNNRGELRYSFTGANRTDLAKITEGLGRDWIFLETLYRIYSTAGYNIAHVDVTARLCEEHNIRYEDIDRIEALVNWLETEYPSPAFPSRGIDNPPQVGSTQYFTAWGAAERGYPLLRGDRPGPGETDPPEVLDLMQRVTLIPTVRRTLFGPRITVFTKDGRSFTKEGTGREFIWDFEEEARRIRPIAPGLAISEAQFAELIDTCRHLDRIDRAAAKADLADNSRVTVANQQPSGRCRSFLRYSGLAQPGEISGFAQGADLRTVCNQIRGPWRCSKKNFPLQPPGFGEFGGGAFGLASEGIGRGEKGTKERGRRDGAARFFEPDDRLVGARLQQMRARSGSTNSRCWASRGLRRMACSASRITSSIAPVKNLHQPRRYNARTKLRSNASRRIVFGNGLLASILLAQHTGLWRNAQARCGAMPPRLAGPALPLGRCRPRPSRSIHRERGP